MSLPHWLTAKNKVNRLLRWAPCTVDHICESPGLQWRVDPRDPEFMLNWVQKFDLLCRPQYARLMTPTMAIGLVMGLFFIPSYADRNGRKQTFLFCLITCLIA